MRIIRKIEALRKEIKKLKQSNKTIGFVPTMGALHEGHLSLIRRARRECGFVVVSIFVNPVQFGPKEDFRKYPRSLKKDAKLCAKAGTDIIFYPDAGGIYPPDYRTYVLVSGLSDGLCGKLRPGHFRGVATVVTKLFNIVTPDIAYFGQKDAQQSIIIKKMVCDLNIPVKIKVMPTIRERGGLALSSRNVYLSENERRDAVVLSQALKLASALIEKGETGADFIINKMKRLIRKKKTAKIDYVSLTDLKNLQPLKKVTGSCLIALAVRVGRTRLIDNIIIRKEGKIKDG